MDITIRATEPADIPAITAITNAALKRTTAHFALTPDRVADIAAQFERDRSIYPWFTAADASGAVVGFSRAARWKTRAAYDWTCESAVYLAEDARGKGLGLRLYTALFSELELRGFRCILAGVTIPNPASERLHETVGMKVVGEFPAVGRKFGEWLAVRYYAKKFGSGEPPEPIAPVTGQI